MTCYCISLGYTFLLHFFRFLIHLFKIYSKDTSIETQCTLYIIHYASLQLINLSENCKNNNTSLELEDTVIHTPFPLCYRILKNNVHYKIRLSITLHIVPQIFLY